MVTEIERNIEDNKRTVFKETDGDDWHCIYIIEDRSRQKSKKQEESVTNVKWERMNLEYIVTIRQLQGLNFETYLPI